MLLQLPVRITVISLEKARVLLSPDSQLSPEQRKEAGEVTDIVAPNLMHTGGIKQVAKAHPKARLWGPASVRQKLPELNWKTLGQEPWPFEAELSRIELEKGAPRLNEHLFLHHASGALFVFDLVFNISEPKGLAAGLFFRLFGTYRRFAVSKLFLRQVKDQRGFEASLRQLMARDFAHVFPAHGDPVITEGKERLRLALAERDIKVSGD